ncbi:hypothetical protein FISHEDRAFT_76486 [Fistulina hepatica ATCC 64428]|uniref:Septin-type G domain-containing protein n=1 Tax=Fistulina hepatica ATCC 64428 TaxID=1128425 RepID=A0A0D7A6V1_9AGAR|nr:hypothetical protein FISHEDRAFT_76486 [Fistulina hepatica ATCC 64428]
MFTFRRRSTNKHESDVSTVRATPSLPELHSQGIPWPETLVDVSAIRESLPAEITVPPRHSGAVKISFTADSQAIPFHKPFRNSPGRLNIANGNGKHTISSIYSKPDAAFEVKSAAWNMAPLRKYTQRRARLPPTFNVIVVGSQGTGKTSFLRLLLETADVSPAATADQRAAYDRFLAGKAKPTTAIQTACVEICESRFERVLLSVIDTPGLEFQEGRELKLSRQVNDIMKYIDAQFADTMREESKVVRKSKGDQHIHLCVYMIDPTSIMTAAEHNFKSTVPTKTRSETTISQHQPPDLVPDTSSGDESDSDSEDNEPLMMSPKDLRVMKRISMHCNVLPVIARADSLTDGKLQAVKTAVRKSLLEAGLDFGVFSPDHDAGVQSQRRGRTEDRAERHVAAEHVPEGNGNEEDHEDANGDTRPVIRLRQARHITRNLSRSRTRRELSVAAEDERRPVSPDATDHESVANVRFSAAYVAKPDPSVAMPYALISPESTRGRRKLKRQSIDSSASPISPASDDDHAALSSVDGHTMQSIESSLNGRAPESSIPATPVSALNSRHGLFYNGPPADLKGVFVRKFRWGTVDVLNPDHCDFAALRTTILSTHLKVLKVHTKEVLYEKYRTEKLLARRATSNISEDEKQRLLKDLGL